MFLTHRDEALKRFASGPVIRLCLNDPNTGPFTATAKAWNVKPNELPFVHPDDRQTMQEWLSQEGRQDRTS